MIRKRRGRQVVDLDAIATALIVGIVLACLVLTMAYLRRERERVELRAEIERLNDELSRLEGATVWERGDRVFHLQAGEVYVVLKEEMEEGTVETK